MVYESEYDLSDFNGNMVIEYKVKGFWNRGALTIFIKRGYTSDPSGYSFTIVAGGGRDTKEVESDADNDYAKTWPDSQKLNIFVRKNNDEKL